MAASRAKRPGHPLSALRNVGPAALADFAALGIADIAQLAESDPDTLYTRLCAVTGKRHDPCVHDVFAAAIHQARTGEPADWWAFTPARKLRQAAGRFPAAAIPAIGPAET